MPNHCFKLESPLEVVYGASKKTGKEYRFRLNLNQYRNTHYIILNKAKVAYKDLMKPQIDKLPSMNQVSLEYKVFPATKRAFDLSNVCTVVDKFLCDALVESGKLPDDNFNHLPEITYTYGSVDKDNPRVEVFICPKQPNNQ